jgi:hypothetical protein
MNSPVVSKIKSNKPPVFPGVSRLNSQRVYQVIPPYRVDLTLAPAALDEVRLAVDISGCGLVSKTPDIKRH